MHSISQNYNKMLEKIIQNEINSNLKLKNITDLVSIEQSLDNKISKNICNSISTLFELIDNDFKNSFYRKSRYYYKGVYPRTIMTIFGEVRFNRHHYYPKNDNGGFFYVDREFNISSYDCYDQTIKAMLIEEKATSSYAKAAEVISKRITDRTGIVCTISRQEVFNILKNFDIDDEFSKIPDTPISSDTLHIILDEKYIHTQDKSKGKLKTTENIMVKHCVVYTGKTETAPGRFKLDNRRVFSSIESVGAFVRQVQNTIDKEFCSTSFKNIIISGDGANWIEGFYRDFSMVERQAKVFVLDKFHIGQAINRMVTDKTERNILRSYVKSLDLKAFKSFTQSLLEIHPERSEKIIKNSQYLITKWHYVCNTKNENFLRCCMEAHISHDLAKVFSRDPKGYSVKTLPKHLKLRDYYLNKINIRNLYIYSNDALPTNEETLDIDFSHKNTNTMSITNKGIHRIMNSLPNILKL